MDRSARVIIWATPRTCSTSLLKCLSGILNAKIFDELYSSAFLLGPDRLDPASLGDEPTTGVDLSGPPVNKEGYTFPSSICTYDWIQKTLEADYPGKRAIISKEIVYCLNYKYESLPQGYRHVFLLRHPSKVLPSWKKLTHEVMTETSGFGKHNLSSVDEFEFDQQPPHIFPPGMSYKEGYELYKHVKEKRLDTDPVIIDADDLVRNPAGIIAALCNKLNLPYDDSLLSWEKGTDVVETWTISSTFKMVVLHAQCYQNFRNCTSFKRQESDIRHAEIGQVHVKVTADIKRCVDFSMPFYQKMYEQRLQGM